MGFDLALYKYSFHLRDISRERVTAVFLGDGKGNPKAKEMGKGLGGHTSIDCTTSTEWATKIYRRGKGESRNGKGKGKRGEIVFILKWERRENYDTKIWPPKFGGCTLSLL